MSTSNAMLLCFASGVPYGFWDRQRFELVPKITKSIKNVRSSQQSSDRSCFCTNTRTTHTRQNKPYRLGVVPAGVAGARGRCCPAGARGRCCPAAVVPVAFVFACGVCCCIAEEIQNKIIDRKKSSAIIVHQAKGTATSTRTTHTRVSKMGFWVCGSGGVFESCTFYLHDGRANRGCRILFIIFVFRCCRNCRA